MILAVDVHSHAYQIGQYSAEWGIPALIVVVLAWSSTRTWRNPVAHGLEEAPRVAALRRRRGYVSILATVLAAGAVVAAVLVEVGTDPDYGPVAESAPVAESTPAGRTVEAPEAAAGYHLITGEAAAALAARMPSASPEHYWFYSATPGGTRPTLMLSASTAEWNPKLAKENAAHSAAWGLRNFFAGARIDDPQDVDAGPLGGAMQCGYRGGKAPAMICRWNDASTSGAVAVFDMTDVHQAAAIALQFRNAAEH
ncbi:hypothetical protein [Kitasatospora cathayae]|uniref:Uncharacterized protein n=1 Tax=Kitasatospora cathayae TaxID=3004092 RepID=A0ABY7QEQ8_9ACTN|nr:hypothetical protein [Kitasatospora sp. HUAS 3-15]WBP90576.1 hypothetical protein O1G21_35080 [Kitasatospora sp. HUAS 3-15]